MKPDHATAGYTLLAVLTVAGLAFAVPDAPPADLAVRA